MKSKKDIIIESFRRHLTLSLGKMPGKSSSLDLYQALALSIRDLIMERWISTRDTYDEKQPRSVNYISLEFLMGRTLGNALINLDVGEAVDEAMKELGIKLSALRVATNMGSFPVTLKEALKLIGHDCGDCVKPILPLHDDQREKLHMVDVKALYKNALLIRGACLIGAAVLFAVVWFQNKKESFTSASK